MLNRLFLTTILLQLACRGFAQPVFNPLPPATYIIHYHLQVGYDYTTILIFPEPIKPVDKGKSDLEFMVQKQPGMENVLKVKASRKDFIQSNLHVFTASGKVYGFDISYLEAPIWTTYDLSKLDTTAGIAHTNKPVPAWFAGQPLPILELSTDIQKVRDCNGGCYKRAVRGNIHLKLQTIRLKDNLIFFGFEIQNRSAINYPIDFVRLYSEDQKKSKRVSFQQNELLPYFKDTVTMIPSQARTKYVVAVPSFTIPKNKRVLFELYEQNGGRNFRVQIKNGSLYHAKSL